MVHIPKLTNNFVIGLVVGSMEIADGYSIRNQKPENAFVGVPVYENPSMKTYSSFATDLTGSFHQKFYPDICLP